MRNCGVHGEFAYRHAHCPGCEAEGQQKEKDGRVMRTSIDSLGSSLKSLFDGIGLMRHLAEDAEGNVIVEMSPGHYGAQIHIDFPSTILHDPSKALARSAGIIIEDILGSELVRGRVEEFEEQIKELKAENERLKQYKTFYEMQFTMNHGKIAEGYIR